ncbi:hypothetical protein K440DRAFT_585301 [Wilcoxina mikolae CBS 423.85]|nr:hypothetical protein K440DRAFT_585301 [Wilcoxina mikolae CBS 423.85]
MASYEDDHNLRPSVMSQPRTQGRRPQLDLDDFFTTFDRPTTSSDVRDHPTDTDAFRSLARAFSGLENDSPLIRTIVETLMREAGAGAEAHGVPSEYLDTLERVPKWQLKEGDICPICNSPFVDDPYPLVVRLPCHREHIFDLECIAPWLKLKSTCPLDRQELVKKKEPPLPLPVEDDEAEWDEQYS